ncbi:restriction endonuclease subunit S [Pseudomonas chlororaphis]|uniref:restriction endonuclease subunit S n=1 Tax=Pseudomonas chlororaphis TaxID=587753 RepID=UPI001B3039F6|nr:restriction endonuclease subunit S [Pseudomonas chlororaphis]MBP5061381.1 restriction endonuclease subunit S [Pseudomonas chlororaphis]QTT92659.1 restriction endonuclease subunit S [Pseudomonas chlororaphis]
MSKPIQSPFPRYQLAELAALGTDTFVDGPFGSSLKSHEYVDAGVRLIQLQNIGEGEWHDENKKFITPRKFKTLERHGAVPGDIAIAKMADPVARACLVPPVSEQFVVVADCIRLRLDESRFEPGFVVRSINSPYTRREAEKKAIGSTRVRINLSVLKTVGCLVPELLEQQAITQILDTLDTAIRETEALIDKLNAVKQGLLQDLLNRGIDANGQLRPPQSEAPQLYKESPLGWIPREWTVAGLTSVALKDRSVIRTGPFGSSLKGEHWRESGRPVVTIGSLGGGAFIESELLFIDEKTAEQLVDFELFPGDIAFSRVADVGRSVVITEEQRGWIMSSNFMRISVDSKKARPRLLQLLLASSILVRKQIRMTVNSAGRDVANSAVLMALRFPWPLPEEQDQIVERVESFERKVAMEEDQHQKLLAAKEGLMDDLLTGRVRVTSLQQTAAPIVQQPVGQPGA